MSTFEEMYRKRLAAGQYICVGLDPDVTQVPDCVVAKNDARRVVKFLGDIVRTTNKYAAAYKLQSSYYEGLGKNGPGALYAIIRIIRSIDPNIPIILDYKRGDIGRSNQPYADLAFDYYGVDAVTIHPYLGMEAMEPFLSRADKTIIVLCRTSNPGAGEFQDVLVRPVRNEISNQLYSTIKEGKLDDPEGNFVYGRHIPLYQFVAHRVAQSWNSRGNCAVVVGATVPDELAYVRNIVGNDMLILIPGIGTQGGDLAASIESGMDSDRGGFILNNSSAILFAYKKSEQPEDYASAARLSAQQMNNAVRTALTA